MISDNLQIHEGVDSLSLSCCFCFSGELETKKLCNDQYVCNHRNHTIKLIMIVFLIHDELRSGFSSTSTWEMY